MSITEKIISIEPFNDIWYINCFYNAMIPIVQYYLGRIDSYIVSDLGAFYEYDDLNGVPSIKSNPINKTEPFDHLKKLGIECTQKKRTNQLVNDIKNAIINDRMVIVCIDCYYEKDRVDTYHVNHWAHALLVHGFTEDKFYISESKYKDSVIYEKREISCKELEECYEGYLINCIDVFESSYYEFSYHNDEEEEKQKADFQKNDIIDSHFKVMIEKRELMEESIDHILLFSDNLRYQDSEEFYHKLKKVTENITDIINNLRVNQYLMVKLFDNDLELTNLFNEVIRHWSGVRGCLTKITYSKSCSDVLMKGIKKKLSELHEVEKRRISRVLEVISESLEESVQQK